MEMRKLPKLHKGDKVAILSPSFAAPGRWPDVYELGLSRVREVFGLEPVEFSTTRKLSASGEERAKDLIAAFENSDIKAVIASIGGDDQVVYIKNLPNEPFARNPKPFFGYSDNSHFCNFLFLDETGPTVFANEHRGTILTNPTQGGYRHPSDVVISLSKSGASILEETTRNVRFIENENKIWEDFVAWLTLNHG